MYNMIIIDDESLVLNYLTQYISDEFPQITVDKTFDISSEALEYIKNNNVDIVLTDIYMPSPSGIEIAEFCYNSSPDTLVIFISAYRDFEYAHSAITYHVHNYLLKPISKQNLHKCLTSAIETLNSKKESHKFASDEFVLSCQEVFSDLICNCITNKDELKTKLSSIGMSEEILNNRCIILDLYIMDFSLYLSNTWKHGRNNFFNTLLRFLCKETNNTFFSPIWYTTNKFEIIGIGKSDKITEEDLLNDFKKSIQNELKNLLKLETKVVTQKTSPSLKSFLIDNDIFDLNEDLIKKANDYIEQNYSSPITLEDVAKHVSLSRVYFSNYYKKHTGENFVSKLNSVRIEKAKKLLEEPNSKISNVMRATGYNHSTYFYKTFKKLVGCLPTEYQEKKRKEDK